MELKALEKKYREIYEISPSTFRFVFSLIVANFFLKNYEPVWALIIGGSGRTKTETLNPFFGLPNVIGVSELTAQSLFSGMVGRKNTKGYGLLQRLPSDETFVLLVKDMSAILSLHPDKQNALFSILRDVYDGRYSRPFGNRLGLVEWQGKVGIVGASTSAIDQHHNAREKFGSRFIFWRIEKNTIDRDVEIAINSMQKLKSRDLREDLRNAVKNYFLNLPHIKVSVSKKILERIGSLATLAAYARSPVLRDSYRAREIKDIPDHEVGTRMANQLLMLGIGLAMLQMESEIRDEDFGIILKSALDSMPRLRRCVLRALSEKGPTDQVTISNYLGLPYTTTKLAIEDLEVLGLVNSNVGLDLSNSCKTLILNSGFQSKKEFWLTYDSVTQNIV